MDEEAGQAHGLVAEVVAQQVVPGSRGVPGRVDEVDDGTDGRGPAGQVVGGRDLERDAGPGDLALGPGQALAHRRLGHEQDPGHLQGGEAAQRAQGEGHPGVEVEGRVTAGEHQAEEVVLDGGGLGQLALELAGQGHRVAFLHVPAVLTAEQVDGLAAGGDVEPRRRVLGRPGAGPHLERGDTGVLQGVLGQLQVADLAGEDGQQPAALAPQDPGQVVVGRRGHSKTISRRSSARGTTGRTSMAPSQAAGICAAMATASSRSAASTR